ncbi:MAG TPA: formate--tetrahydrofolate ligase, partial [Saprospiraceae bacterium]|nr:formate--tetrahydrofolate ligase [Saprospiraceae bacterium]
RMGLSLSDYVITEAGFGFDLGAEKFFDIKCQSAGLSPNAVVLVATVRALKYHGGVALANLKEDNPEAVERGMENLEKHLENISLFGVPAIVAMNRFITDSEEELAVIKRRCELKGAPVVLSDVWEKGGAGAEELAHTVAEVAEKHNTPFTPLYDWNWPVEDKIKAVATRIYGASEIDYTSKAKSDLQKIASLGLQNLPICIAKTQKSLSDNPKLLGRPKDFVVTVREIEIATGAGFLIPITGEIMRMPGLPAQPAAENIDIDDNGNITGLF